MPNKRKVVSINANSEVAQVRKSNRKRNRIIPQATFTKRSNENSKANQTNEKSDEAENTNYESDHDRDQQWLANTINDYQQGTTLSEAFKTISSRMSMQNESTHQKKKRNRAYTHKVNLMKVINLVKKNDITMMSTIKLMKTIKTKTTKKIKIIILTKECISNTKWSAFISHEFN